MTYYKHGTSGAVTAYGQREILEVSSEYMRGRVLHDVLCGCGVHVLWCLMLVRCVA